jgi:hypothetical protein
MVHEIYHCHSRAINGGWELHNELIANETPAVEFENHFRKATGLCERTSYAGVKVASSTCAVADQSCPAAPACREDYCCVVFGGVKIPQMDGGELWGTCLIPHSTVQSCNMHTVPGQSSAGAYPSDVCLHPDPSTKFCGQ